MKHYRTIFISDIHFGTRGCKAEYLADFLSQNTCDTLYLVGDIIDGWHFRSWHWSPEQSRAVDAILTMLRNGTRVIYVPGNHDEFLRSYIGRAPQGITLIDEVVHVTADGKRILVLHGDKFDSIMHHARWLAHVGDHAYGLAMWVSEKLNFVRKAFGLPYWSLSAWLKHSFKEAVQFISHFEETVAAAAQQYDVDGVLCGHIHTPCIRKIGKLLYLNDGDWVESCSAIVEYDTGNLEIIYWQSESQKQGVT